MGQVHVFGALQVPPFKQDRAQTAKKNRRERDCYRSQLRCIRIVHVAPVHDDVQVHVFGAVHAPLFWQGEAQTAKKYQTSIQLKLTV